MCAPKDAEVSNPEVYGSVSEKLALKYGVLKTQGVTTPLGSLRVKEERMHVM